MSFPRDCRQSVNSPLARADTNALHSAREKLSEVSGSVELRTWTSAGVIATSTQEPASQRLLLRQGS